MKEKLTHNLGLKILSVVLAIFTWLIMVNVSNPMMTVTQTIPVEMINADVLEDAGLAYELMGRDTVTVSYRVHVRDQNRIGAGDFTATADLSQLYDVTGAVPVQVEVSNRAARQFLASDVLTTNPSVVRVQTEPIQTKSFALTARTSGTVENGYAVGTATLSPAVVYVTGAESVIGQISSAGVEIQAEGANTDLQGQAEVNFYDANDNRLELENEVSLSMSMVNYDVTVLRVKDLTLDFRVEGEVAAGYRFTGVTSDVQTVSVVGLRSVLSDMTTLVIAGEALNIEDASRNVEVTVNLADYLPDGVSIAGDSPSSAVVTMTVEPLETMSFTYDVGQIDMLGLSGQYRYAFADQQMELRIRGLREELEALDTDEIQAAMDLHGLEPGEHQVNLTVELPEGFEFVGPASVMIRIEQAGGPGMAGQTVVPGAAGQTAAGQTAVPAASSAHEETGGTEESAGDSQTEAAQQ